MKEDDFQYAIENTQVILAPEQKIATFGTTSFRFYLISELMDRVNEVRVRDGKIHADRPQILTPEHFSRLLLEGFGEKAQRYADQLREHAHQIAGPASRRAAQRHHPRRRRSLGSLPPQIHHRYDRALQRRQHRRLSQ